MLTLMSNRISSFFVANNVIQKEDREVYEYSLEILLSTLLNFVTIIIISFITNNVIETIIYLLGFIPLRSLAGGYHAKNHFRCFMIMLFAYSTFLIIIKFIPIYAINATIIISAIISTFLIFLLSPVEDKNKPLSETETKSFKIKSRISILVYLIIIAILYFLLPNKYYALSLVLGTTTVSLSLLASDIKNKINALKRNLNGSVKLK